MRDARMERFPIRQRLSRHLTFNSLDAMLAWVADSARHYGGGYYANIGRSEYEQVWSVSEYTDESMGWELSS